MITVTHIGHNVYEIMCGNTWSSDLERDMSANGLTIIQVISSIWSARVAYIVSFGTK